MGNFPVQSVTIQQILNLAPYVRPARPGSEPPELWTHDVSAHSHFARFAAIHGALAQEFQRPEVNAELSFHGDILPTEQYARKFWISKRLACV